MRRYADDAIAQARSNADFLNAMGIHAAAEAMIGETTVLSSILIWRQNSAGGWLAPNETSTLLATLFNDLTQVCSLSGFNTSASIAQQPSPHHSRTPCIV
jgi:hypothetical protein